MEFYRVTVNERSQFRTTHEVQILFFDKNKEVVNRTVYGVRNKEKAYAIAEFLNDLINRPTGRSVDVIKEALDSTLEREERRG